MAWQMGDIDPKSAIEDALAATASLFAERGIAVGSRLPSHMPAVHADRDRLIQVIVNLLSNAAKFTAEERPQVLVEAQLLPDAIQVTVADNGPGIPRNAQAMIFEKFQQARETLTDKPRGSGLGLPICRQIVEHFGGRIWLESRPRSGSRFSFTVPYAKAKGGKRTAAE